MAYVSWRVLGMAAGTNGLTDDPERYADAPISLQLVGRRYEDEKLIEALEMMLEIAGMSCRALEAKL